MTAPHRRILASLAVTLALAAPPLTALGPETPLSRFGHDHWQSGEGLPQNSVEAIAQTADGYLWFGTEEGLARFDGTRFVTFTQATTPALRHNSIKALLGTQDGSLWIGTNGGGLTHYRHGRFTDFGQAQGITAHTVSALAEDHSGHLWIGTNDGLLRYDGERIVPYGDGQGIAPRPIRSIRVDRQGVVWVGTGRGAYRLRGGRFETVPVGQRVRSIAEGTDGAMWFGTADHGVVRWQLDHATTFDIRRGLPTNDVRAIHVDRHGGVWIGTNGSGILRLVDGSVTGLTTREGFSSDFVRAIFEDRDGSLWFGTEGGGLNRLRESRLTVLDHDDGLGGDFVRAVIEDRQGRMWLATDGAGLTRFDGHSASHISRANGLPENFVYAMLDDGRGRLWLGTDGGGLAVLEGSRARRSPASDALPSDAIFSLAQTRDERLWVGTGMGLVSVRHDQVEPVPALAPLRGHHVAALHVAAGGTLWIGARNYGVWSFDGTRLVRHGAEQGFGELSVSAFHEDAEGTLWIATRGGLLRIADGRIHRFTTADGLLTDNIYGVVEGSAGQLWMSSTTGLFRVGKDDLDRRMRHGGAPVTPVVFNTSDGMKVSEATGGGHPSTWRRRDGTLWFPTPRGVVVIDTDAPAMASALPPPVFVEQVQRDGQAVPFDTPFDVPASTRTMTFGYTALSFLAPAKTRFRYRLEGLEREWVQAGARREVTYTDLPDGRYTFRVIAANGEGAWNETGAAVSFTVLPPYYRSAWFLGLCVLGLVLAGWGGHRSRMRAMRQRFAAVLAERGRVARELHDTLLQGFAGVSLQLDAVRHGMLAAPDKAATQLDRVLGQVDSCLTEARRSIWNMRAIALEEGDLVGALRTLAARTSEQSPVRVHVDVDGDARRLPAAVETDLLRVGQEAMANAIRHASADLVRITVRFDRRLVSLSVHDNGRGFDAAAVDPLVAPHYGLRGMRERVERLGGTFALDSQPGQGTTVDVRVPLRT